MSIDLLVQEASKLFALQGFLQSLGLMMALAMGIGALLDDDGRRLGNWLLAILVFGGMAEVFRYYVLVGLIEEPSLNNAAASIVIAVTVFVTDVTGLAIGWTLARVAKNREQIKMKKKWDIAALIKKKEEDAKDERITKV